MSSRLTVGELEVQLKDLVCNWDSFGRQLPGITESAIEEIKYNKRDNVKSLKAALFGEWLEVYPDASWDDVITGLQKIGKNTIAKHVEEWLSSAVDKQMSLSPKPPLQTESKAVSNTPTQLITQPNHKQQPTHSQQVYKVQYGPVNSKLCATPSLQQKEYKVSESIVEELEDLHETFVPLATEVKRQIQEEVVNGKVSIQTLASYVHEQSVGPQSRDLPITSATNTEQILQSVQPAYTFLSPNFILNLATFFLVLYPIANKADEYKSRVTAFKKSPKVRLLKNKLGRFNEKFRNSSSHILLKILVTNAWGEQSIRLVEMLLLTLFPIVHPDDLPWYSVCAGSILLSFIATNHMMLPLIVSCARKIELMRHLGIISVTIGNVLIRVNKDGPQDHDDDSFTFENSLIEAIVSDDIEAVEFVLKYIHININETGMDQNGFLLKMYHDQLQSQTTDEDEILHHLKLCTSHLKALQNEILFQQRTENEAVEDDPCYKFCQEMEYHVLNIQHLQCQLNHLPNPVQQKLTQLYLVIQRIKQTTKIKIFEKFFQSFPALDYTTLVTITLNKVWSEHSVEQLEEAIKILFPYTPLQNFYWYRVKPSKQTLKIKLLITLKPSDKFIFDHYSAQALGVIKVQVKNETVFKSRENRNSYTFEKGIREAKKDILAKFLKFIIKINIPGRVKNNQLIDHNNNYQMIADYDATPLILACCISNSQIVQLLLDHGADPNVKTRESNTALFFSVHSSNIFQMLLDHGADVEVINEHNGDVLQHACTKINNLKVVKILLTKGCPDVNRRGDMGTTALNIACAYGQVEIVDELLNANADPNLPDYFGITPLISASINGHLLTAEKLIKAAQVDPNDQNTLNGRTPLWMASVGGHEAVVDYLLQAKADPNIPDNDGITPIQIAGRTKHYRTASILFNHILESHKTEEDKSAWIAYAENQLSSDFVKILLLAQADPSILNDFN